MNPNPGKRGPATGKGSTSKGSTSKGSTSKGSTSKGPTAKGSSSKASAGDGSWVQAEKPAGKAGKRTVEPLGSDPSRTGARSGAHPDPAGPRLLAGGNPQIAKGYGEDPVQAYIAAMPGWKSGVGKRLDELIERAAPQVRKAVKYNSPLYGLEGRGWFLGIHTFKDYVKVAFFRGASLRPVPPGPSKQKDPRYLDIREGDALDEDLFMRWVKQAADLPGENL